MKTSRRFQKANPLAQALKLLTIRPRSKRELVQLLLDRKYPEEEINGVISHLVSLGYLDDVKYMESWCYYRKHISPKSRWYVLRELSAKGVSSHDLDTYFNEFYSEEEELSCLRRLIEKKLAKKNIAENTLNEKDAHKIVSALLRKGFKHNLILDMFSQLGAKLLDNYKEK